MDGTFIDTVKMQFFHSFRTGNVVLDTLITGLIITASAYLASTLRRSLEEIGSHGIWEMLVGLVGLRYNTITLTGRVVRGGAGAESSRVDFSSTFKAVLEQIKDLQKELTLSLIHI